MASSDTRTFGDLLRELREARGLTQENLADRAAMSVRGLRYLELGGRLPYSHTRQRLAEALALSDEQRGQLEQAARTAPPVPSRPETAALGSLPISPTPLIGRDRELAETEALLRGPDVRLLTLTGFGGVGKTRLALELAARLQSDFADGVKLIALDAIGEGSLVNSAIAQALGVREAPGQSAQTSLIAALRERAMLLIVDNFEQVTAAAPLVAELVGACPRLRLLVTSRAPLRLRAEHTYLVEPLAIPEQVVTEVAPVAELLAIPAVALFVQSAERTGPGLPLQVDDVRIVAAICRRLDGLPLAIELAAARTRILPLPALLARLDRGLPLLTGGSADLPERQQTLRRAIAWSPALLHVGEQALFRRLAVFADGCTLDAVETVCVGSPSVGPAGGPPLRGDPLDWLESLVAKSLLSRRADEGQAEPRFAMLETVREFGLEQLDACEETTLIRDRHLSWCVGLAEEADVGMQSGAQAAWVERLHTESANLRAAIQWAATPGGPDDRGRSGVRIGTALWHFWQARGRLSEGRAAIAVFDGHPGIVGPLRARADTAAGNLALLQGDLSGAAVLLERSAEAWRGVGDAGGLASALNSWGQVALFQGSPDRAQALLEEGLTLMREVGNSRSLAAALTSLGHLAHSRGRYERAREAYEESLGLVREFNQPQVLALALTNLGTVSLALNGYPADREYYEESLRLSRLQGDTRNTAVTLNNLGTIAEKERDYARPSMLRGEPGSKAVVR
ncbi:MAG TPA: tetratricopeptide repeat protein [Chloroflexota bacterium]|nr:tetratricopeptide repeat protein [Chloroflexota bacterium]